MDKTAKKDPTHRVGVRSGPRPSSPRTPKKETKTINHPAGGLYSTRPKVSLTCSFLASDPPWSWVGASFLRSSGKQKRNDPHGPEGALRPEELSVPRAPGAGVRTCGPMAIPRGGFILIGPPMLGCPAGPEASLTSPTVASPLGRQTTLRQPSTGPPPTTTRNQNRWTQSRHQERRSEVPRLTLWSCRVQTVGQERLRSGDSTWRLRKHNNGVHENK